MQWHCATKHLMALLTLFFSLFSYYCLFLHIPLQVPKFIKHAPPYVQYFLLPLYPAIAVQTKEEFCMFYRVFYHTVSVVVIVFTS